jgi:hypothetical protein
MGRGGLLRHAGFYRVAAERRQMPAPNNRARHILGAALAALTATQHQLHMCCSALIFFSLPLIFLQDASYALGKPNQGGSDMPSGDTNRERADE